MRLRCSFCRRSDSQVAKLVAGPRRIFGRVYICDRCAAETIRIMEDPSGREPSAAQRSATARAADGLGPGPLKPAEARAAGP